MNNKRRILGIVVAAVLAILGTASLVSYVQSARDNAVADETLVDVYVVDRLIPQGAGAETITGAVSVEQVPARLRQPGVVEDLDDIGDLVAVTDLQPGDQLLEARLVKPADVVERVTDKVEVAVLLTPERAVGGTLAPGDLVGVYLSFDPFKLANLGNDIDVPLPAVATGESGDVDAVARPGVDEDADEADETGTTDDTTDDTVDAGSETTVADDAVVATLPDDAESPNVTRLEFQHVLVTNVQTTTAPVEVPSTDPEVVSQVTGSQYIVTIALSPEESERLVFAAEFGRVWLANEPATVSDDGTRLVTLGNVYEVEQS